MRPLEVTVRARLTEKSTHAHGARPRPRATLAGMSETTPPGAGDGEPSAEEIDAATRIQAMHRGRVARRGIRDGAEGAKNADAFSENAVVAAASNEDPPARRRERARPGDVGGTYAAVDEAERALGWRPKIGLREGIAMTEAWYRTEGAAPWRDPPEGYR